MTDFNPVWGTFQWDKGILNSRMPRLHFSQRWCRGVMIRTSVWPWELLLGTTQAQTHAKPRLCQPFEEQRAGERDHNEYLKKNPFTQTLRSTGCLCGRSYSVILLFLLPFFHLVLRICWSLQVTARLLTKDDKAGGRDFYTTALSQLAWPRPGPRRTHHLANSPHQQKDNRETAFIRFNGWLWWRARSK